MDVGKGKLTITHERDPSVLPHGAMDVDIVLECSGRFNSRDKASSSSFRRGKKVLVSAPASAADFTVVYGVNHDKLRDEHLVVSNASCTTNCLAPMAKVMHTTFGMISGNMTTIHAYTGDQNILDNSHKDLRRARSGGRSIVPTTTGAARQSVLCCLNWMAVLMALLCVCPQIMYLLLICIFMPRQPVISPLLMPHSEQLLLAQ